MIKKVSALRTLPAKVERIVPKRHVTQSSATKHDDLLKEKLSYIIHAEKQDTFDPFMTEHFDYLKYLGVKD